MKGDLEQWASSHETSAEIALAIDEMCKTETKRERLWQDPSKREITKILARAWELAGDKEKLFWGIETIQRHVIYL